MTRDVRRAGSVVAAAVVVAAVVAGAAVLGPTRAPGPQGDPARVSAGASCPPYWSFVASPNPGVGSRSVNGVDVGPGGEVVIGGDYALADKSRRPLLARWDGSRLVHDAEPPTTGEHVVHGVSGPAPDFALAVGSLNTLDRLRPAVERFDGSRWSDVAGVPRPDPKGVVLYDVDARAADDAWAVGFHYTAAGTARPLLLQWDGTGWSAVSAPDEGTQANAFLQAVVMVDTDDVWAVGYRSDGGAYRTLALHYDGAAWTAVPTPNAGDAATMLNDISFADPAHGWAVGIAQGTSRLQPFMMRWDGQAWTAEDLPVASTMDRSLFAVSAVSGRDVWAMGGMQGATGAEATYALHFDGSEWLTASMPTGDGSSEIADAASGPGGESWAVGNRGSSTLVARLCPAKVTTSGFEPDALAVAQGTTVVWQAPAANTAALRVRQALGGDRTLDPGGSLHRNFTAAGTFTLQIDGGPPRTATVSVPVRSVPTTGGVGTRFRVQWATVAPPAAQVFDVQVRRPGSSSFVTWRSAVRGRNATFVADAGRGTYELRARPRETAPGGAVADWSPALAIVVS